MESQTFSLVLTALEGISHHDPTMGRDSNILTFNRQKQIVYRRPTDAPVFRHLLDAVCEQNPMPSSIEDLTSRLSAPEWLGVAYVRLLLDIHNEGDGEGLLAGMERYRMLENRLQTAAVRCHSLHRLWSVLVDELQLGVHSAKWDDQITAFWTLPPSIQYQMLTAMTDQYRAVVTLARLWHTKNKLQDEAYCERAGVPYLPEELRTIHFADGDIPDPEEYVILNVPAVSVNSIRHQLVREPAFLHLCHRLGFEPSARGEGPLSPSVEAIFYNGGNILAGATQPSNAFHLAGEIREAYPSLDLLGGVASSFDLGESKLKASAWIVCAENADALPEALQDTAQANTSVFEMLDSVTRTRQASPGGEGQMIYNYETLVKGTQIYVELTLTPYTGELTRGALAAALEYYIANDNVVGGQSARGHGHVRLDWLSDAPAGSEVYEAYLEARRDRLHAGMLDKTLCSSAEIMR